MRKVKTISFNDFMTGEYKLQEKARKARITKKATQLGAGVVIPLAIGSPVGAVMGVTRAFASTGATEAVPAGTGEWIGEKSAHALAHVLDPLVDVLVSLSLPIASVIVVASCFWFMFGKPEKGWQMIQNAGLGYVLIQVSPLLITVLKQIGDTV